MAKKLVAQREARPKQRPASTAEGREAQLIAMAIDLAEEQLQNGTASSQVITHFLKLGTEKEKLERQKLEMETEKLKAQAEALRSAKRMEELYQDAIKAFGIYKGEIDDDEHTY